MCTAISYQAKEHYFGRNLDVECGYEESVVIKTPSIWDYYSCQVFNSASEIIEWKHSVCR